MGSGSSTYKQHNAGVDILEKMWTKISVQQMSRKELNDVIVAKYGQLDTVVDRLLDIYLLLSAGGHEDATDRTESDAGKFLTRDGRLISTRYYSFVS